MHEDGTGATKLARSMGVKHVSSFLAGVDGELFNPFKVSIEQSRFALGLPQEKFIIGMIGRIDRLKGVLEVVKSFLETARPGELLVIAGEANNSSYYSRLIQIIETHQNSQQVIFIGPMPHQEVPSFLAACDLLVFNSSFSNFHLALAETLMMGRASLVRDAGVDVIKEELLSCGSVKLYSNEDDELRRALEEARRGTSKERFSEQEHFLAVSLFGWDKVLGTIENAYAKTLLGHSK